MLERKVIQKGSQSLNMPFVESTNLLASLQKYVQERNPFYKPVLGGQHTQSSFLNHNYTIKLLSLVKLSKLKFRHLTIIHIP